MNQTLWGWISALYVLSNPLGPSIDLNLQNHKSTTIILELGLPERNQISKTNSNNNNENRATT